MSATAQTFKPAVASRCTNMRNARINASATCGAFARSNRVQTQFSGAHTSFAGAQTRLSGAMNVKPIMPSRSTSSRVVVVRAADDKVVVIGLAADSGCGKSTFMRRVTGIFGGNPVPPEGGNPDSNTLISDMTTVICLDDYHSLDRNGRKVEKVTALDPKAQNFDLMYEQVGRILSNQIPTPFLLTIQHNLHKCAILFYTL
jgi:hypothetical protein